MKDIRKPDQTVWTNIYADAGPDLIGDDVHLRLGGRDMECTFEVQMNEAGELEVRANGLRVQIAVVPLSDNAVKLRIVPTS